MLYENDLLNAVISLSTSGDNTVIAAPSVGYIAIDHINFIAADATNVILKSGSTALSGTYAFGIGQAIVLENTIQNPKGVITCKPGEAFIINLGSSVVVGGFIKYRIVK